MFSIRRRPSVNVLILLLLALFILYSLDLVGFRIPKVAVGSSNGGNFFTNTRLALEKERAPPNGPIGSSSLHHEDHFVSGNPQNSRSSLSSSVGELDATNKLPMVVGVTNDDMNNRNLIGAGIVKESTVLARHKVTDVEYDLDRILSISPVVIFSKTTCPFSAKAKNILLQKYSISPAPHVLELDQHPLGPSLQKLLAARTGRSTVPNVLIHGQSIGGCDEVTGLDREHILATKILKFGKQNIQVQSMQTD